MRVRILGAFRAACAALAVASGAHAADVDVALLRMGVGSHVRAGDPTVIEPGMTFHMIPSMFLEGFGMWFSETVAVTETGCEVLTDFPRRLIEIETPGA